ncbi:lysosomal acid glucosylceramidase [Odontomachus brunneus]|uniref:lysosomal acid glucosylceramidase n=1 Tax=Odontomachus brunneus TaxID=486640 RepID=UPI0013F23B30|nr:lysosomal acid glucosylceramidase [Odontomachus brunneus]XP_032687301.1 lysosomal acid glucosylceramidase [Odontomachus brunneus]XP_032687302.1 lysosomal acid glucosylceramidase [Odontomachus brunneus]XP_032687303.1 lysosomal acid glucosylceramidase [Odontomachus brunneus]XP_032687305.1 lysosomal acid glucosylceramidase [Odontomachus brunneus]
MMRATILLLIAASAVVTGDNNCVQREVGPKAIVCVCNSTYCDFTSDIQVQENQFVWYTSTRNGERLQKSVANYSKSISEPVSSDVILIADSSIKFQKIFGFGGAMTDAAALNIRTLSTATQKNLIESYYGINGSRYTFCRIPIAGTDFSTRPYTYDDIPNDITLSNWSLVEEDDYKINYLHQIKNVMSKPEDLKIFTTAWSAPKWMKKSNEITWGPLKPEFYQLYADYILKFFDAYKERGIDIWGMTPGNEPIDGLWPFFPFNAMLWTPETEGIFSVNNLRPTLSKAGYNPVYMAMDDQRFEIPTFSNLLFNNKEAKEMFNGTAFHWYEDQITKPKRLDELHDMYPDKFILMTEACAGSNPLEIKKVDLGSWQRGEEYILDIIENLSHWTTGWVDWNLALNESGAPNWAKNFVDSPIIVIPEDDEFYKQPMYYAIYHFSKFVPPNSIKIFHTESNNSVNSIAFLTPEGNIVFVIVNKHEEPYNVIIQDKMTPSKQIHLQIPEKSFTTVQYRAT